MFGSCPNIPFQNFGSQCYFGFYLTGCQWNLARHLTLPFTILAKYLAKHGPSCQGIRSQWLQKLVGHRWARTKHTLIANTDSDERVLFYQHKLTVWFWLRASNYHHFTQIKNTYADVESRMVRFYAFSRTMRQAAHQGKEEKAH